MITISSKSVMRRLSQQMSLSDIVKKYNDDEISLRTACEILNYLGYTAQERRRIIEGINKNKEYSKS